MFRLGTQGVSLPHRGAASGCPAAGAMPIASTSSSFRSTLHGSLAPSRRSCVGVSAGLRMPSCPTRGNSWRRQTKERGRTRTVQVSAVFEQFSDRSIEVAMMSQQLASKYRATEVRYEHVFLGLVAEDKMSRHGYMNSGLSIEKAADAIHRLTTYINSATHNQWATIADLKPAREAIPFSFEVRKMFQLASNTAREAIPFSSEVRKMFQLASNESQLMGSKSIFPEHILLACLEPRDSFARRFFTKMGVDCDVAKAEARHRLMGLKVPSRPTTEQAMTDAQSSDPPKMLHTYCRDLCEMARNNQLDPLIGRATEVNRTIQILGRRFRNNPLLIGDPGVGKTAIAEGLAQAIVSKTCPGGEPLPEFLVNKRIMQLDISSIVAGAKERGEMEKRVTELLKEVKQAGDVILMIDEVHTLIGAGSSTKDGKGGNSGMIGATTSVAEHRRYFENDSAMIGATTVAEHRRYFENDSALNRRLQPVLVEHPSEEISIEILLGLRTKYETTIGAIDLLDEAGSKVRIASHLRRPKYGRESPKVTEFLQDGRESPKVTEFLQVSARKTRGSASHLRRPKYGRESPKVTEFLQTQVRAQEPKVIEFLQTLEIKEHAVSEERYEDAYKAWLREESFREELVVPSMDGPAPLPLVTVADIEAIVAARTGIPVERMERAAMASLANLASSLKQHIVGQDEAVNVVSSALQRAYTGLKDPKRPIASLLFVGPTGVGKTELAKVLAEHQFGSQDALIRFDMSEFMERHSVSKLIGVPPGFGDGGKLTEAVRLRPFSIVLLDEVEKAHPDVFNILLQIMEDGRLTDSGGRVVSFKNTMIILTSNVGSRVISTSGASRLPTASGVPSQPACDVDMEENSPRQRTHHARMQRLVLEEVRTHFRPELINRFDEQVVFQQLDHKHIAVIAQIMLQRTIDQMRAMGHSLDVGPRLMDKILSEGYSTEYGARPLRRAITRLVEDNLSDEILAGSVGKKCLISMELDGAGNVVMAMTPSHSESNNIISMASLRIGEASSTRQACR
eukprot:gene10706-12407_t